ncbi:MAG TPA: proton-conducting transporter membrane subunit [Bellilinea sp.]|nr:proton-conducting transporter membrane subunit [Bellilinea sp.]
MSAPIVWIVIPGAWALLLWLLRRNQSLCLTLAAVMSFILALLSVLMPIGETVNLGSLSFTLPSTLPVLGRRFVLTAGDQMILTLLYGLGTVWFGLAILAWPHRLFPAFGLGMLVMLVAALAVEPFLYAALLVETAVLFSLPILSPPGREVGQGLQRYLIFQTLAMLAILFAGWLLGVAEANPADTAMFQRAGIFLGLGFAFWLGVFPFYNWLPMMVTETHPFPAGFVLSLLPTAILLLGLDFINATGFLRESTAMFDIVRIIGVVMVITAGLWAAFEVNLARLLGYAVIFETGFALLAINLNSLSGYLLFAAAFLPRLLALLVFAFSLAVLENQGLELKLTSVRGMVRSYPLTSLALLISILSLGGFPLLAGLPVRLEIFEQLAATSRIGLIGAAIGTAGFLFSGLHLLSELVHSNERTWRLNEARPQRIVLVAGCVFLIAFGLFPEAFYNSILLILQAFPQLF